MSASRLSLLLGIAKVPRNQFVFLIVLGLLAIAGNTLAIYRSGHIMEAVTWSPLHVIPLPEGSRVDRMEFSPNGIHLACFESSRDRATMKVWSIVDPDEPDSWYDDVKNLLGQEAADQLGFSSPKVSFAYLDHESYMAGFAWSPLSRYKNSHLLMTWTREGLFSLWVPEYLEKPCGNFIIIRSFFAKAAWFDPEYPIRLTIVSQDDKVNSMHIENFESPSERLVDIRIESAQVTLDRVHLGLDSIIWRSNFFLLIFDPNNHSIQVYDLLHDFEDSYEAVPTFRWSFASSDPLFPLQIVSPYNMLAASVFSGTMKTMDVCRLGAECSISDYIQVEFDEVIKDLQWVTTGQAVVTTEAGCWVVGFDEDPLVSTSKRRLHSRDDLLFVGLWSTGKVAAFWDKQSHQLIQYTIDEGAHDMDPIRLADGPFGFIQILDCAEGPHLVTGSGDLKQWLHYDLQFGCTPEKIFTSSHDVRLARTSIFGDIALVSPHTASTDNLLIVTPTAYEIHADAVFSEEHDRILAVKWVVVDGENYVRHLVVCSATGIVVYAASLSEDFKETWHRIDMASFPISLAPPIPTCRAAISCNKFLDIWVTIDEMIVMWAPVEESPVWAALRNALTPSESTFQTSRFFTELYSLLLDPNATGTSMSDGQLERTASNAAELFSTDPESIGSPRPTDQNYDFLFLDEGSGLFSRDSTDFGATTTAVSPRPSIASLSGTFEDLVVDGSENFDGPGRKFLLLNRVKYKRGLKLEGLDYLCAFLSDAQEALTAECTEGTKLTLQQFSAAGFAFWLKNTSKLTSLVELCCRTEYALSNPLEKLSLFYLLLGKKRSLQVLWKKQSNGADPSHSRIGQFLHHDFSLESHRLIASKNAYASLSKQKFHLAIMFFLLAEQHRDALVVALDSLKDPSLAMLIARLSSNERVLLALVEDLHGALDACSKAILRALIGETDDVVGTCLELIRACEWNTTFAILPVLVSIKLPIRHSLTPEESEHSMQVLLRQGAFETASTIISLPALDRTASVKCHLSLLRLAAAMASQRWRFFQEFEPRAPL